jgi:hypothetical protein
VLYGIVDLNSVEMETLKDDVVKLKRVLTSLAYVASSRREA